MSTPWRVFRDWQIGFEATRGTSVAATRRLYVIDGEITKEVPQLHFPEDRGEFVMTREANLGDVIAGIQIRDAKATFEDIMVWLEMAVMGDEAPAGIDPYTWTYLPDLTTDDLKTATIEWDDGANQWEVAFCMVNVLTIRGTKGDVWHVSAEVLGDDKVATTLTAALTDFTKEAALMTNTQIFIDSVTIGTTQVTARLLEFEITITNNIAREFFAESGVMQAINRGKREVAARVRLKFSSLTEYNAWLAETTQKVRIRAIGSDGVANRKIDIDLYGRWQSTSFAEVDGMIYADLELLPIYDATLGAEYQFEVINHISAL